MTVQPIPRSRRRRDPFGPCLETLEERSVPTVQVFQAPGSNLITLTALGGTSSGITISDNGTNKPGAIEVFGDVLGGPFSSSGVPTNQSIWIQINMGAGRNDAVGYFLTGNLSSEVVPSANRTTGRVIFANLAKKDTFLFSALNKNIESTFLDLFVKGGQNISVQYHGQYAGNGFLIDAEANPGNSRDRVFVDETFDSGSGNIPGLPAHTTVRGGTKNDLLGLLVKKAKEDTQLQIIAQMFGGGGNSTGITTLAVLPFGIKEDVVVGPSVG
jgi:hypothetical protein